MQAHKLHVVKYIIALANSCKLTLSEAYDNV
jgi:hypothetical protein